jgi:hypothetical protein
VVAAVIRVQRNGREVIDTGKVYIGLRHESRYVEQGEHAKLIQRLLTTPLPRQWVDTPRVVILKPTLWGRIRDWWLDGNYKGKR